MTDNAEEKYLESLPPQDRYGRSATFASLLHPPVRAPTPEEMGSHAGAILSAVGHPVIGGAIPYLSKMYKLAKGAAKAWQAGASGINMLDTLPRKYFGDKTADQLKPVSDAIQEFRNKDPADMRTLGQIFKEKMTAHIRNQTGYDDLQKLRSGDWAGLVESKFATPEEWEAARDGYTDATYAAARAKSYFGASQQLLKTVLGDDPDTLEKFHNVINARDALGSSNIDEEEAQELALAQAKAALPENLREVLSKESIADVYKGRGSLTDPADVQALADAHPSPIFSDPDVEAAFRSIGDMDGAIGPNGEDSELAKFLTSHMSSTVWDKFQDSLPEGLQSMVTSAPRLSQALLTGDVTPAEYAKFASLYKGKMSSNEIADNAIKSAAREIANRPEADAEQAAALVKGAADSAYADAQAAFRSGVKSLGKKQAAIIQAVQKRGEQGDFTGAAHDIVDASASEISDPSLRRVVRGTLHATINKMSPDEVGDKVLDSAAKTSGMPKARLASEVDADDVVHMAPTASSADMDLAKQIAQEAQISRAKVFPMAARQAAEASSDVVSDPTQTSVFAATSYDGLPSASTSLPVGGDTYIPGPADSYGYPLAPGRVVSNTSQSAVQTAATDVSTVAQAATQNNESKTKPSAPSKKPEAAGEEEGEKAAENTASNTEKDVGVAVGETEGAAEDAVDPVAGIAQGVMAALPAIASLFGKKPKVPYVAHPDIDYNAMPATVAPVPIMTSSTSNLNNTVANSMMNE